MGLFSIVAWTWCHVLLVDVSIRAEHVLVRRGDLPGVENQSLLSLDESDRSSIWARAKAGGTRARHARTAYQPRVSR